MLGAVLTSVAGASSWYRGGVIVYDDALKHSLAGVSETTLSTHGAVSMEVASELAAGIRIRCSADIGIGITGIAGPGGGSADKPVGLVHLAIDDDGGTLNRELRLAGDRESVRRRAVAVALDRLRRRLLEKA
jgi:nicotinamide-nucleotide amidase